MNPKLYIIIGAYGSGKSEYAVHLARTHANRGEKVCLVDMDVVNPYFRVRDVRDEFAALGMEVIAPEGSFSHADLPMISPRIKGAIQNMEKTVILDVGGDPAGCRALGRFVDAIRERTYEMFLVANTSRPFTGTIEDIEVMIEMLEFSSKLRITEMICNTNLMQFTDADLVLQGIKTIEEVALRRNLNFEKYLVLDAYEDVVPENLGGKKREVMSYTLKKPWEYQPMPAYRC